jgi:hypothetical protein
VSKKNKKISLPEVAGMVRECGDLANHQKKVLINEADESLRVAIKAAEKNPDVIEWIKKHLGLWK